MFATFLSEVKLKRLSSVKIMVTANGVSIEMNKNELLNILKVNCLVGRVLVGLHTHSTLICSTRMCYIPFFLKKLQ